MINLLKADLKLLIKNKKNFLMLFIFFPLLVFLPLPNPFLEEIEIVYLMTGFMLIYGFEDKEHIRPEKLILSLPVTRREVVFSKYLLVLIMATFNILFINLYGIILRFLNINNRLVASMADKIGAFLLISIVTSICLPLFFAMPTKLAQVFSFSLIFFTNSLCNSEDSMVLMFIRKFYGKYGGPLLMIISLGIFFISSLVSVIIYEVNDL